jgi:hypothetical protein
LTCRAEKAFAGWTTDATAAMLEPLVRRSGEPVGSIDPRKPRNRLDPYIAYLMLEIGAFAVLLVPTLLFQFAV